MGTILNRILALENLRRAWEEVAENRGMAGVDDVSIKRWQRNWEERLVNLARDVRANRYKPGKLRARRIPKRQRNQYRTLRIPTVTDRVLQRAVLQQLYPLFEPHFLRCSFGYRPGKSLHQAVTYIVVQREQGFTWVLDADIDEFFDSVDHTVLLGLLKERLDDLLVLHLIEGWLGQACPPSGGACGIPMGGPLSPLLANIYLHPLDVGLTAAGWRPVRYADDFVVLVASQSEAQLAYECAGALLEELRLRYEPQKTAIRSFSAGFDFLGVRFEDDAYQYTWQNKTITVTDPEADWLFGYYGPDYG
ncbi:MAG: hypothetical protein JW892_02380 [Anaerolineae bacterium]|nr:hypothetical protein [Anaerolineae bacterium]